MGTDQTTSDFDERDQLLIEALGNWLTHEEAGELAGLSAKTIQRRFADPNFSPAVFERRRRRVDDLTSLLGSAAVEAIGALRAGLKSTTPAERLGSARTLLDLLGRYHREQLLDHDVTSRIAVLERSLQAADHDATADSSTTDSYEAEEPAQ